jgi:hypothetical protein
MKEQFNQSNSTGRPGGNGNTRQADLPERTEQVAERARAAAIEKVEHARDRAREGIDQGREQVAARIRRVGSALRSASDKLREEDAAAARYADLASESVERAANYLGSADLKGAVRDLEGFARRQPALFFGGAFLIGLAAGRFLQSSQHRNGNGDRGEFAAQRSFAERDTATDWPRPPRPAPAPTHETDDVFDARPTAERLTPAMPAIPGDPRRGST